MTPGWYVRRLRAMDASEVLWRARSAAIQALWRTRGGERWPMPRAAARWAGGGVRTTAPEAGVRALVATAEQVLDGCWPVFETQADVSGSSPNWFLDPATGRQAPSAAYCFTVPHRDEGRIGSVKHLWELSRLQHVTVLAAAFQQTGDPRYAERAVAHVRSWCLANPPLCGIHWVSGIELGLRLIAWAWTRRLLDGFPGVADAFERSPLFQRQLHAHQCWIATFHSRGTSANNHLVAEMAGLLAASLAFPMFEASGGWAGMAAAGLEREIRQQTFPDGMNREMAASYHASALELFLVAGCEADAAGAPLSDGYWSTVGAMADALAATVDAVLSNARQGDCDDGRALVLDRPSPDGAPALLEACARVMRPAAWWPWLRMDSVGAVLLAGITRQRGPGAGRPTARPNAFPSAGVTILRGLPSDDAETGAEIWCRVDHGPHGYLATAAHAHADALSFELRLGGCPVLVDPGTYCYGDGAGWREYFRSTVAHNTVELHGRNQALQGGPFLWLTRPGTRLLRHDGIDGGDIAAVEASHDGYAAEGAVHRRTLVLDRRSRILDVIDTVEAAAGTLVPIRLAFNLHPDVACDLRAGHAELSWRGKEGGRQRAVLTLPQSLHWEPQR